MSATAPSLSSMQRSLQRIAHNAERHIRQAYRQDRRSTLRREMRAESAEDIRAAIAEHCGGAR